jgi:hypothetical protein
MDPTAAWLAQSLLNLKCHAHCWYATAHQTVGLWSEIEVSAFSSSTFFSKYPGVKQGFLPLNLDACGFALLPPINDLKISGCTETCKMFKKHGPQVVYFLWRLCQGWHPCVFMSVWKGPSVHLSINILSRKMSKGRIPFNRKQYRHQNYSYIISINIHIVFAARRGTALECWLTIPWAIQNMDIASKGQRPIQIYLYIYRERSYRTWWN